MIIVPARVIEDKSLHNRTGVYRDRDDAGVYLAGALEQFRGTDAFVLAIPSGGVPVGLAVSSRLGLPFDLLIIRKIPVPGNTESGFGAVSLEGDMVLNDPMVRMLRLTPIGDRMSWRSRCTKSCVRGITSFEKTVPGRMFAEGR